MIQEGSLPQMYLVHRRERCLPEQTVLLLM